MATRYWDSIGTKTETQNKLSQIEFLFLSQREGVLMMTGVHLLSAGGMLADSDMSARFASSHQRFKADNIVLADVDPSPRQRQHLIQPTG